MKLQKYLAVFKISWQSQSVYRAEVLLKILIASVVVVSTIFLWADVYGDRTMIKGYSRQEIMTYYILVSYLFTFLFAGISVADDIQTGSLSKYLVWPLQAIWYYYWLSMAKRFFRFFAGLPVVVVLFWLLRDQLVIVTHWQGYASLFLTIFGAINILFLTDVMLAMLEFWFPQSWAFKFLSDAFVDFCAGALIPVAFLPFAVQRVIDWLPFRYTGTFVIDVFLGRAAFGDIVFGFFMQCLWVAMMAIVVGVMWHAGLRRYEAVGN